MNCNGGMRAMRRDIRARLNRLQRKGSSTRSDRPDLRFAMQRIAATRRGGAREGASYSAGYGVDRLALRAAVLMIDPVALIMPLDEARTDELGDTVADIGLARRADALTHLVVDQLGGLIAIGGKHAPSAKLGSHAFGEPDALGIALAHRRQCVAQPVTQRHWPAAGGNEGPGAARGAACLCDQVEDHEGVTRPQRCLGENFQQRWEIGGALVHRVTMLL